HACAFTQKKDGNGHQRECGSDCVYFYRSARSRKCHVRTVRIRRKAIAQRGSLNFRKVGRKQRWKSAGSKVVSTSPSRDRSPSRCHALASRVTTIVSLAARDFIAVGCDSYGT